MTKKTKKAVKVKGTKKILKVEIVQPEIEIAPTTYKQDPAERPEPTLLPSEPTPESMVNPNDPKIVGIDTGFKRPSITNTKYTYTAKQYKELMENWLKENSDLQEKNPAKYKAKKSELESKMAKAKG